VQTEAVAQLLDCPISFCREGMISSSHQGFREDNGGATVDGDRGAVDERCLLAQQKACDD
jgi:hypothetical protein